MSPDSQEDFAVKIVPFQQKDDRRDLETIRGIMMAFIALIERRNHTEKEISKLQEEIGKTIY